MSKNTLRGLIALILVGIIGLGSVIAWGIGSHWGEIKNVKDYYNGWGISKISDNEGNDETDNTSLKITPDEVTFGAMALSAVPMVLSETGEAIEVQSETSKIYRLVAIPEPVRIGSVTWTADYADNSTWWAQGHSTDECIKLTTIDNWTVEVECLKAFASQITITAHYSDNGEITASCKADYQQSLKRVVPLLKTTVNGTEYSYTQGMAYFASGSVQVFNDMYYQIELSDTYTLPFNLDNSTLKFSVKTNEYINGTLEGNIKYAGIPGSLGVASSGYAVIDQTTVTNGRANKLTGSSGEEHFRVNMTGAGNYKYAADFCSAFYTGLLDTATHSFNSNVTQLISAINATYGNPMVSYPSEYRPWYWVRSELSVDGINYVFESEAIILKEAITVRSISLDPDQIVF